jgi:hypothetical protein
LANRLLAYRVALELEARSRMGRRRGRRLRASEMGELILKHLVVSERRGESYDEADDYDLATKAGVSVRQTRELYEEIGFGALVREVLDGLGERGLVTIARKTASREYRGFRVTDRGRALVDLRPWYQRWIGFFDPPP